MEAFVLLEANRTQIVKLAMSNFSKYDFRAPLFPEDLSAGLLADAESNPFAQSVQTRNFSDGTTRVEKNCVRQLISFMRVLRQAPQLEAMTHRGNIRSDCERFVPAEYWRLNPLRNYSRAGQGTRRSPLTSLPT